MKNGLTPIGNAGRLAMEPRLGRAPTATSATSISASTSRSIWATGLPQDGRRLRDRPHRHLGDDGHARSKKAPPPQYRIRRGMAAKSAAASRTPPSASSCRASPIWRCAYAARPRLSEEATYVIRPDRRMRESPTARRQSCMASASTSRMASLSSWSGLRAAASRRLLRMIAGLESDHRRRDQDRRAAWSTIWSRRSGTSRWCSRTTRSIRR